MDNPLKKTDEWIDETYRTIGGSSAAASLGLDPWKSRSQLAAEIRDPTLRPDLSDKPEIRRGIFGERAALFALQEHIGRNVVPHAESVYQGRHVKAAEYPHAHCLPDAWIGAGKQYEAIAEAKVVGYGSLKKIKSSGVPDQYMIQCAHNIAVTGVDVCFFVAFCFDWQDVYVQEIKRDDELINMMMPAEADFLNCVRAGDIIEDGSPLAGRADRTAGEVVRIEDATVIRAAQDYLAGKTALAELEEQIAQNRDILESAIGSSTEFRLGDSLRGTWRWSKPRMVFDQAAALRRHPDLADCYHEARAARPLIIRPIKAGGEEKT